MNTSKKRICKNCVYWEWDRGFFTATGWTGAHDDNGNCHYEPKVIYKKGDCKACSKFEEKE